MGLTRGTTSSPRARPVVGHAGWRGTKSPRVRVVAFASMAAVLALLAVGCGDDPTTPAAGPPAALSIVDGDDQTGTVGEELPEPLVVRVEDAAGRPVKGVVLNFRVTSGGGTVFAGSSSTNEDGEARERWTLGTVAGELQSLEVRAVDSRTGEPLVFGSFEATAVSGAATALRIATSPDASIRSGVAMTPTAAVELLDRYGNLAKQSGVSVDVALAPSSETRSLLGPTSTVTDAMGVAAFSGLAVVGPPGQVVLRFSSSGLTSVSTGALTLGAGQPARVAAGGPVALSGTAGAALTTLPRVIVTDLSDNPVAGVDVTFAVSSGGGVITPTTVPTDANGVAALTSWTLPNQVGSFTVTATVGAIPNASVVFTASVGAGTATRIIAVSAPNHTVTAGSSLGLVVRVSDAFDNPVEGATVAWTTQGGSVAAATSASNAAGEATVTATAPTSVAIVQRVTAALPAGPSVEFTISAVAAPADRLERFTGGVAMSPAGTPVATAPAVRLVDAFGNPIAGTAVTFEVTAGGGSITGTSATTDAAGVARVGSWTLGPLDATENTLVATAGAETVSFTTTSTSPISIGFTSPAASQAVGNTLAVSVSAATSATGGSITSVVANVADRQTSLNAAGSSTWTGELGLQGLPTGEHYFRVAATDRDGNVRRDSVLIFLNDAVPTLTVMSPAHGSVVSGPVALRASCQDDSPNCTVEISGDFSATGTGSIDIPAFNVPDGTSKVLVFTARDAAGHAVSETRRLFGESSTRLTRVDSAPGGILDVDAGRILYTAGALVPAERGTPGILNRSTRQNELMTGKLIAPRSRIRGDAYLAPNVAILKTADGRINEWRSGVLTTLASTTADLVVKGDYALWGEFAGLRRRNLATQQTEPVNGPVPHSSFIYDVGPNGAVAYKSTNNIVSFVLPGSPGYSCCGDFVRAEFPLTDGEATVFSWSRIVQTDGYTLVRMASGTASVTLGPETGGSPQTWYRDYQVNAGWVAYAPKPPYLPSATSATSALHVRSPAGVTTTVVTGSFAIESLAPNGTVVFSNGSDRFVAVVNGGSPTVTRISAAHGYVYWVENSLFVAIGNTLFQANY